MARAKAISKKTMNFWKNMQTSVVWHNKLHNFCEPVRWCFNHDHWLLTVSIAQTEGCGLCRCIGCFTGTTSGTCCNGCFTSTTGCISDCLIFPVQGKFAVALEPRTFTEPSTRFEDFPIRTLKFSEGFNATRQDHRKYEAEHSTRRYVSRRVTTSDVRSSLMWKRFMHQVLEHVVTRTNIKEVFQVNDCVS